MMSNGICISCGCKEYDVLMKLDNMPACAQNLPTKESLALDKPLDLNLCQCRKCGLVQFDIEPVSYYRDVIRAGGGTATMRNLRHDEYRRLLDYMRRVGVRGHKIVEVGCGQGEFLQMWSDFNEKNDVLEISGIENSIELVNLAKSKGLNVSKNFAEKKNIYDGAPFDAFVQFNYLEHQPRPAEMLRNIWMNLKDKAVGLITVPSFEYIIENDGYYELMRDHIANYTYESLQYLLENNGFKVLEHRIVNRDTIEVIVQKGSLEKNKKQDSANVSETVDVKKLVENFEHIKKSIYNHVNEMRAVNKTLAIWGASHQAFTLAATTKLNDKVEYIIDSAHFKQGRYSPVSHIPIVNPDYYFIKPVDEILIVAPGYTDEIAKTIKTKYDNRVRILMLKDKYIRDYETEEVV